VKSTHELDMNNARLIEVGDPEDATDAATKQYVDIAVLNAGSGEGGTNLTSYSQIEVLPGYPEQFDTDIAHIEGVTVIGAGLMTATDDNALRDAIGLEQVDNTADLDKPVSNATQAVLDLKANVESPTFTGTVSGISKAMVGLDAVDNTSDANKPLSNAAVTALGTKTDTTTTDALETRVDDLEATSAAGFLVVSDTDTITPGTPSGTPVIRVQSDFIPPANEVEILSGAGESTDYFYNAATGLNSHIIDVPVGTMVGEVLVAVMFSQGSTSGWAANTDGWSILTDVNNSRSFGVAWYPVTDSQALVDLGDEAVFSFSGSTTQRITIQMYRVTGADLSTPVGNMTAVATGSTTTLTTAARTVGATGATVNAAFVQGTSSYTVSWNSGLSSLPPTYTTNGGTISSQHIGWIATNSTNIPEIVGTGSETALANLAGFQFVIKGQ
jgi:hypothetical protein